MEEKITKAIAVALTMGGLVAGGLMAGGAALLGGTGVATAHAEPGVTVAPGGSRYYGDQGDGNGLAYLAELRDVGLTGGTPVDAAVMARGVCMQRAQGTTALALVESYKASGDMLAQAVAIVNHAEWHFCPDAMYTWPGN
jgi:hypothetical protein